MRAQSLESLGEVGERRSVALWSNKGCKLKAWVPEGDASWDFS